MVEVVIVGAGTAGLITARALASNGINVTVYDGKKTITEGTEKASGVISINGLNDLGIDYKQAIINDLWGAVLCAGAENLKVKSKTPIAHVVDRGKLITLIYKSAIKAGAKVKLGRRIPKEKMREIDCDVLVGADGAISNVASAFNFPEIPEYVLTYKAEYTNTPKIEDKSLVELFFQKEAQRLFGWAIPYGEDMLETGIGITRKAKITSTEAYRSFFEKSLAERLKNAKMVSGHASLIPLQPRRKTAINNTILVGDAAGQVKATTGGGIVFGSLCATVASEAITNHIKHGKELSLYETTWRRRYGKELKLHAVMHEYYSIAGEKGLERFFKLAKILGAEKFLSEYGDMDKPGVMLKRLFIRAH
jgi:geranylgeranyl reductase family protein